MNSQQIIVYILSFLILMFLRVYNLEEAGLYDYDSVKNYLILQEIYRGDFTNFFHHLSPSFYIFYLPFYAVFQHYLYLEFVNCLLNTSLVLLITHHLSKKNPLNLGEVFCLNLLLGTSFFILNAARFFSIETMGMLSAYLFCLRYFHRLQQPQRYWMDAGAFLLGVMFTFYYKVLLLLPFFLLFDLLWNKKTINLLRPIQLLVSFSVFPFFLILVGLGLGLEWWAYPANFYAIVFNWSARPPIQVDYFYYFKYLFYFENPLVWAALLIYPILYLQKIRNKESSFDFFDFIFFFILYTLLLMSLLPKAPRGLSLIYPLLYLLAFTSIKMIFSKHKWILYLLITLTAWYQIYLFKIYQYDYTESNYALVAKKIESMGITKIATTVGLQLIPYLDSRIEVKVIFSEKEIPQLKESGFEYILLDDFYKMANLNKFSDLETQVPFYEWEEPALLNLMIHLENSDYTGFDFENTLMIRNDMLRQSKHLHLIKLK